MSDALQSLRKYVTKRERLERAMFVGPMAEAKVVMNILFDNGWRIPRSGPYTDSEMHPKCDDTRFLFIAECITEEEQCQN